MFESLFAYPGVQKRHQEAPFAVERAKYLAQLAERGMPRVTLQHRADYCRHVVMELDRLPQGPNWDQVNQMLVVLCGVGWLGFLP